MSINKTRYHFPKSGEEPLVTRPVIVGSGPAGLFCGWYLARAGYRPLILERGRAGPGAQADGGEILEGGNFRFRV